jgi:hypothetical protein
MSNSSSISLVNIFRIKFSPLARSIVSILKIPSWLLRNRPHPFPPHLKRRTIVALANKNMFKSFVETGTYRGDMLARISKKTSVNEILSIELSEHLAAEAKFRFRKDTKIKVLQGDSGEVLLSITKGLPQPALFWLDGHYSGGITAHGKTTTPIFAELQSIATSKRDTDVLLIDDIRLFNGHDGYPTLEELTDFIHVLNPKWNCLIMGDFLKIS